MHTFYQKIESEYEMENYSWNLFPNLDDLSEADRIYVRYEFLSLNSFESDLFKKEIEESKEQIINYFSRRTQEAKNPHLLARYNHFLLYITRNNSYASKTLKYYQEVLLYYLSTHNQDYHTLHISDVLNKIISLSTKHKISEEVLKNQIDSYLKNPSLSSKVKTFILEIIGKNQYKLFKSAELSSYPQLCIDIATNEDDTNVKERVLKTAVLLAQKTSNKESGRIANEMLGDLEYMHILPLDENNIAVSHLNENHYKKIINYYRLAGQKEKTTKAIREFEENKKHHKYIKIQSKIPIENAQKVYDAVNEYIDQLLADSPEILILKLCLDDGSLSFPSNEMVKETIKRQMNESNVHEYFSAKLSDFNNNTKSVSHEELGEHKFYDIFLHNHTLPFVVELLKRSIDKKQISYSHMKRTLEKAAFGIDFNIHRGDSEITYTWFSLVDIGIQEFFKQCKSSA